MKKLLLVPVLLCSLISFGQGERKSPHDTLSSGDGNITVTYGRPYKKGREVFGTLVPYGKVWRLGADEATTISFARETSFGKKIIPAGTYTLFAIPADKQWTFIINKQLGQWGAFSYEKNKDQDLAQFTVPAHHLDSPIEQFTIRFSDEGQMVLEWDVVRVYIPIGN